MIRIDGFAIDAAIKEKHSLENEATSYPVENGSKVSDHLQAKPRMYEVEGVVSDTPIGSMVGVRDREITASEAFLEGLNGSSTSPTESARAKLESVFENTTRVITIVTELKTYQNMLPLKLEIPKSKETSGSFEFTATFQQLIIANNDRVIVRSSIPFGASQNLGDKSKDNPLLTAVRCMDRNRKTGVCNRSEVVKRGADGKWHHPDGSVLSKEELSQWGNDQETTGNHQAVFDKERGIWVDKETGQPISKYPNRAYWNQNKTLIKQGKTSDNFWDVTERKLGKQGVPTGPEE